MSKLVYWFSLLFSVSNFIAFWFSKYFLLLGFIILFFLYLFKVKAYIVDLRWWYGVSDHAIWSGTACVWIWAHLPAVWSCENYLCSLGFSFLIHKLGLKILLLHLTVVNKWVKTPTELWSSLQCVRFEGFYSCKWHEFIKCVEYPPGIVYI